MKNAAWMLSCLRFQIQLPNYKLNSKKWTNEAAIEAYIHEYIYESMK